MPPENERQLARALRFARVVLVLCFDAAATADVLQAMRAWYAGLAPTAPRLRAPPSRMTLRLGVEVCDFRYHLSGGS